MQQTAAAAGKTLDVSFTLPVLPTGLTSDGLYVLQSALKYGVKIGTVNVMAMDFGDSAAPNPQGQMGTYAIDSAQSVYTQLGGLYGSTLSSSQLYGMIGVTPMIGVNDASDEVFEPADASQLVAWAEKVGLGELSFWSLARDQEDPTALSRTPRTTRAPSSRRPTSSPISSTPSPVDPRERHCRRPLVDRVVGAAPDACSNHPPTVPCQFVRRPAQGQH